MIRRQDVAKEPRLEAWLKTKLPQADDLSITPLEKASSGFSNDTYLFDLRWREDGKEKTEKLVVRWPPESFPLFPDYDVIKQFRVMQCLDGSGVPVPKMYWTEQDEKVLGVPFYIMAALDGEVPPDTPPGPHGHGLFYEATPERRTKLWQRSIDVTAQIHTLDWKKLGLSFLGEPKGVKDALNQQIDYYERMLLWAENKPFPLLHNVFDWIKKNRFEPNRVCLCWGDARPGNIMYRDDEVVAVMDWEMANLGPPEVDLAWLLLLDEVQIADYKVPRLQGIPTADETIRYYERITGKKLENYFYYEVFASLRSAVIIFKVAKNIADAGIEGFPPDFGTNNASIRKLKELLGL
jgi:aminoglycoside phosphotransferase (APT) family kinase protein